MIEVLRQAREGRLDLNRRIRLEDDQRAESCGALAYLDGGLEPTIRDLYVLMIILSDNTATNILIDLVTMDSVNQTMRELGYRNIVLERKMMALEALEAGLNNYVSPDEIGDILEKIYLGQLIDPDLSAEMVRVLKLQQVNYKLPYLIDDDVEIAHKTGENRGVSHDVGIVYSRRPFIFGFYSNNVNVIEAEEALRNIAYVLYVRSLEKDLS